MCSKLPRWQTTASLNSFWCLKFDLFPPVKFNLILPAGQYCYNNQMSVQSTNKKDAGTVVIIGVLINF